MNLFTLQQMAQRNEKIAVLTSYDASFAALCDKAGVDALLVGDSLGMVLQGADSTLAVTMHDMQYHTRCVAKGIASGTNKAYIITDMPFGSYQQNPEQALRNAIRLMAAGAHMVKIEGGAVMCDTVRFLVERGIPVCAHLGLTPQSVHQLGGYRVQGKTEAAAQQLMQDAKVICEAGASLLVLEMVPATLAKQVTEMLTIPTIGIGAGVDCSGQVLVLHDLLGIYAGNNPNYKAPRFVRNFMQGADSIQQAVETYVKAVKSKEFPTLEHSF
ncbi:MAG: 3-methyl-2-oxobutanoate hydroxymethyltransferase [Methylophilaceae bacterium]|nr:3-methyl-2-oxobutanoate hydroxymethyltransferase [Methylophilaceae bacterium]